MRTLQQVQFEDELYSNNSRPYAAGRGRGARSAGERSGVKPL